MKENKNVHPENLFFGDTMDFNKKATQTSTPGTSLSNFINFNPNLNVTMNSAMMSNQFANTTNIQNKQGNYRPQFYLDLTQVK